MDEPLAQINELEEKVKSGSVFRSPVQYTI